LQYEIEKLREENKTLGHELGNWLIEKLEIDGLKLMLESRVPYEEKLESRIEMLRTAALRSIEILRSSLQEPERRAFWELVDAIRDDDKAEK
jgi:hypothetical protein